MRLAGIEGVVARSEKDMRAALDGIAAATDIGMVLVTEKIADTYQAMLDEARKNQTGALLITVPSTGWAPPPARTASPAMCGKPSASRSDGAAAPLRRCAAGFAVPKRGGRPQG